MAYSPANRISLEYLGLDRKSTRLNSSHLGISYAVFCLKKNTPTNATVTFDQHGPENPAAVYVLYLSTPALPHLGSRSALLLPPRSVQLSSAHYGRTWHV